MIKSFKKAVKNTHSKITKGLKHPVDNSSNVIIIYGPDADEESLATLRSIKGIVLLKTELRPSAHYMIVDDNVRVENYHVPYDRTRYAYTVKKTSYLAEKMEREFAQLVYLSQGEERISLT